MNALLIYLFKSSAALGAMYLVYYLFLRRDTFFMINRVYLLGSLMLAAVVPFIPFHPASGGTIGPVVFALQPFSADLAAEPAPSSAGLDVYEILLVIYLTGTALFLLRLMFQFFQIFRLVRKSEVKAEDMLTLVYTSRGYSPFSFFNYVFINRRRVNADELKGIIAHERVHARQGHSFDLLLFEFACVFQWFNPFMWMALYDLRNVHEFLADEGALKSGMSGGEYRELIYNEALGARMNYLTNNFNISPLKKRIIMMTKPRSAEWAKGKLLIALPAILTVMVFFAGTSSPNGSFAQGSQTTQYNTYETQAGTVTLTPPRHQKPPQDRQAAGNDKEYKKLDKDPAYPGGYEELFKFILANIKYPTEAMKQNLQGKVLVSFVLKTDGSIADVKVTQGLGGGCDEEAVRVVKLMPKWTPGEKDGKPVEAGMVLPIQFKLDEKKHAK